MPGYRKQFKSLVADPSTGIFVSLSVSRRVLSRSCSTGYLNDMGSVFCYDYHQYSEICRLCLGGVYCGFVLVGALLLYGVSFEPVMSTHLQGLPWFCNCSLHIDPGADVLAGQPSRSRRVYACIHVSCESLDR